MFHPSNFSDKFTYHVETVFYIRIQKCGSDSRPGGHIEDIVASLEPTMAHDGAASAGSSMAYVRENMAKLPLSDRRAIVAYLKAIPAIASKD